MNRVAELTCLARDTDLMQTADTLREGQPRLSAANSTGSRHGLGRWVLAVLR